MKKKILIGAMILAALLVAGGVMEHVNRGAPLREVLGQLIPGLLFVAIGLMMGWAVLRWPPEDTLERMTCRPTALLMVCLGVVLVLTAMGIVTPPPVVAS